jgi:hypothetical protein
MSQQITSSLRSFGVTPWQLLLGIACIGSWWATVQPLPGQLSKLTETVQQLSMRVEIHTVLLKEISEVKQDLKDLRADVSALRFKSAATSSSKTLEGKIPQTNELSPHCD